MASRSIENATLFAEDTGLVCDAAEEGVLMASLSWNATGPLANGRDDPSAGPRLWGAPSSPRWSGRT